MIGAPNISTHKGFSIGGDFKKEEGAAYNLDFSRIAIIHSTYKDKDSVQDPVTKKIRKVTVEGPLASSIDCFRAKMKENLDYNEPNIEEKDKEVAIKEALKIVIQDKKIKDILLIVFKIDQAGAKEVVYILSDKYKKKFNKKNGFNEIFVKINGCEKIKRLNLKADSEIKKCLKFSPDIKKTCAELIK